MKQLMCEMCGSKDLLKDGGVFVCQSCGCKYTVEEAKKMMVEGTVEVTGTVKVDNSAFVDNYLNLAKNAFDSDNNAECERYCNQVLEIDANNYLAWYYKGCAAGWQSSIANDRIMEASRCFLTSLSNAPEEEKRKVVALSCSQVKKLCTALVSICCNNYSELPSVNNAKTLISKTQDAVSFARAYTAVEAVKSFEKYDISAMVSAEDGKKELEEQITVAANIEWLRNVGGNLANMLNSAQVKAWKNVIWKEYQGSEGKPDDYDLNRFIERGDAAISILKTAIEIEDSIDDKIQYYENLKVINTSIRDCQSWEKQYTSYGSYWVKSKSLTFEAKNIRTNQINSYSSKISSLKEQKIKEEEKKRKKKEEERKMKEERRIKAIEKYWEEHAEEKASLEAEKEELLDKRKELENIISDIEQPYNIQILELRKKKEDRLPEEDTLASISEEISSTTDRMNSLGLFKGKEKSELRSKIENDKKKLRDLEVEIESIKERRNSDIGHEILVIQDEMKEKTKEFKEQLLEIENRTLEINAEFNKDR